MLFNVTYVDGSMTSNRRVPLEQLDERFGESLIDLARSAIEVQDDEISERANQRRPKIKSVTKV
jgi:hypothetical protein